MASAWWATLQFWLTRPYDWRKFLAAKLLFVAVFVGLPFFAAQMLLLAQAGFNPFAYIPGLLFNLLLVTGGLIVPLMAVSTVTSGFRTHERSSCSASSSSSLRSACFSRLSRQTQYPAVRSLSASLSLSC